MDGEQLLARRRSCGHAHAPGREPLARKSIPDGLEARFVLGMAVGGAVEKEALVVEKAGCHRELDGATGRLGEGATGGLRWNKGELERETSHNPAPKAAA